jgi:uncharacterized alkaline shock family protein YloU
MVVAASALDGVCTLPDFVPSIDRVGFVTSVEVVGAVKTFQGILVVAAVNAVVTVVGGILTVTVQLILAVVSQVAGIAAQEVEKVQMGGGTSAAVGGFLQGVAGSVTGSSAGGNASRGVSVEVGEEEAAIDLTMAIEYGQSIPQITEAARRNVINRVENLVGLRVTEVNITVNDVQVPEERPMLGEQERVEQQAREQEQQA